MYRRKLDSTPFGEVPYMASMQWKGTTSVNAQAPIMTEMLTTPKYRMNQNGIQMAAGMTNPKPTRNDEGDPRWTTIE